MQTLLLSFAFLLPIAQADECQFFYQFNQAGQQWTAPLPAVTDSVLSDPRSNTSFRYNNADMQAVMPGMIEDVRSVRIIAQDSDVAAYIHAGMDFSMDTRVFHCEKGHTCDLDNLGLLNDRVNSFKCQREFGRKSNSNQLANPVIDTQDIRTAFAARADSSIQSSSSIVGYNRTSSTLGWFAMSELCRARGWFCSTLWYPKYRDLMLIDHDFEIQPWGWAFWYQASIGYSVEPRLDTTGSLDFWEADRSIWVESGFLHDAIEDGLVAELDKMDIGSELRDGVLLAAGNQMCPTCSDNDKRTLGTLVADNKERYQFSYFPSPSPGTPHPTVSQFSQQSWTYTAEPKLVLNAERSAQ